MKTKTVILSENIHPAVVRRFKVVKKILHRDLSKTLKFLIERREHCQKKCTFLAVDDLETSCALKITFSKQQERTITSSLEKYEKIRDSDRLVDKGAVIEELLNTLVEEDSGDGSKRAVRAKNQLDKIVQQVSGIDVTEAEERHEKKCRKRQERRARRLAGQDSSSEEDSDGSDTDTDTETESEEETKKEEVKSSPKKEDVKTSPKKDDVKASPKKDDVKKVLAAELEKENTKLLRPPVSVARKADRPVATVNAQTNSLMLHQNKLKRFCRLCGRCQASTADVTVLTQRLRIGQTIDTTLREVFLAVTGVVDQQAGVVEAGGVCTSCRNRMVALYVKKVGPQRDSLGTTCVPAKFTPHVEGGCRVCEQRDTAVNVVQISPINNKPKVSRPPVIAKKVVTVVAPRTLDPGTLEYHRHALRSMCRLCACVISGQGHSLLPEPAGQASAQISLHDAVIGIYGSELHSEHPVPTRLCDSCQKRVSLAYDRKEGGDTQWELLKPKLCGGFSEHKDLPQFCDVCTRFFEKVPAPVTQRHAAQIRPTVSIRPKPPTPPNPQQLGQKPPPAHAQRKLILPVGNPPQQVAPPAGAQKTAPRSLVLTQLSQGAPVKQVVHVMKPGAAAAPPAGASSLPAVPGTPQYHQTALDGMCRVCSGVQADMREIGADRQLTAAFKEAYNIDIHTTNRSVSPTKLCSSCATKLQTAGSKPSLATFPQHKVWPEFCDVCTRYYEKTNVRTSTAPQVLTIANTAGKAELPKRKFVATIRRESTPAGAPVTKKQK